MPGASSFLVSNGIQSYPHHMSVYRYSVHKHDNSKCGIHNELIMCTITNKPKHVETFYVPFTRESITKAYRVASNAPKQFRQINIPHINM